MFLFFISSTGNELLFDRNPRKYVKSITNDGLDGVRSFFLACRRNAKARARKYPGIHVPSRQKMREVFDFWNHPRSFNKPNINKYVKTNMDTLEVGIKLE